jgi:hypothetical protein
MNLMQSENSTGMILYSYWYPTMAVDIRSPMLQQIILSGSSNNCVDDTEEHADNNRMLQVLSRTSCARQAPLPLIRVQNGSFISDNTNLLHLRQHKPPSSPTTQT